MVHVVDVQPVPLLQGQADVPADLGQPGHARQHVQPAGGLCVVVLQRGQPLRPGPHQAHVPLQDVEQLGQLVHLGPAQETPCGSDPRVIPAHLLPLHHPLGAGPHGPELVDAEHPAAEAGALLQEEHGAGGRQLHQRGRRQKQGEAQRQQQQGCGDIEEPLGCRLDAPAAHAPAPPVSRTSYSRGTRKPSDSRRAPSAWSLDTAARHTVTFLPS